jgi:uncharacterized lipoprotein YehR (DUF1307 family)
MKAYTTKHQGKTYRGNMTLKQKLIFLDGTVVYSDFLFYKKKDAKKYLATLDNKYIEVVGVTVDKSKTDNRYK